MKSNPVRTYSYGIILFALPYLAHADCTLELPPNEEMVIHGDLNTSRLLTCSIIYYGDNNDYLLNFITKTNTSFVNHLMMPEGTLMSLSFASLNNDNELKLKLESKAQLGITNDSDNFIHLKCREA
ncbi:Uncharacterised protein [Legionella wadsworthii]|uniref:Secreted protein n=1 Tax=Legionella wadsworthii TaxID=28088 RepID=A0A378LR57_9GAMM|nr:hypothetical protein [Legionella wadsworthii]STY28299.1 Uncharacterised protein [Legionella wadsworthii]